MRSIMKPKLCCALQRCYRLEWREEEILQCMKHGLSFFPYHFLGLHDLVHVSSVKHFTSGYQSEISHAVYILSKLLNSTGRQPVNPQMWSGRSKPPPANGKYVNCYNF